MILPDNPATESARFKPATGKDRSSRTSPFAALIETAGSVILGKTHEIKVAFVCLSACSPVLSWVL